MKPEYREAIRHRHWAERDYVNGPDTGEWAAVAAAYPHVPGLALFAEKYDRADFFPRGVMNICAEDFGTNEPVPDGWQGFTQQPPDGSRSRDGESYSWFHFDTGVWEFACSLKNYMGEIEVFVRILARICDAADWCESLYETDGRWPEDDDWRYKSAGGTGPPPHPAWWDRSTKYLEDLPPVNDDSGHRRVFACRPEWRTEAVVGLATGIRQEGAFDRLPVLADALDDAGCTDAYALAHLRHPGYQHDATCFVLAGILGPGD